MCAIADLRRLRVEGEADEADAGALAIGAEVEVSADGFPGQAWAGRIEEVADSVTLRALKPQDPARPTDTRILAVKVALSEATPLRLGTTVELGPKVTTKAEAGQQPMHAMDLEDVIDYRVALAHQMLDALADGRVHMASAQP